MEVKDTARCLNEVCYITRDKKYIVCCLNIVSREPAAWWPTNRLFDDLVRTSLQPALYWSGRYCFSIVKSSRSRYIQMVGSAAIKVLEYSCCNKHTDINPHVVGRGEGVNTPKHKNSDMSFLARNMLKRATCSWTKSTNERYTIEWKYGINEHIFENKSVSTWWVIWWVGTTSSELGPLDYDPFLSLYFRTLTRQWSMCDCVWRLAWL